MDTSSLVAILNLYSSNGCPFVFFRLPNVKNIEHYWQDDDTLLHNSDLKNPGFVFAPYKENSPVVYIPAINKITYPFESINPIPSNINSKPTSSFRHKKDFINLVKRAKKKIKETSLEKVVVSRVEKLDQKTIPQDIFLNALHLYPSAMVYYFYHPKVGTWIGATPEILINHQEGILKTMALAATQNYGIGESIDWSNKEKKEQALVCDQVRSDLDKVFPEIFIKESDPISHRAGNLVHLCSYFKVNTPSNFDKIKLLNSLHPTPAVGGLPKASALTFLKENEGYDRKYYTGFLGPNSENSTHLFVNLRCMEWFPEKIILYVGAGITVESDPIKEWEETQIKTQTLRQTF
jgi:isochorismate synthase